MSASNTNRPETPNHQLRRLSELPDEDIDTSDSPEVEDWSKAERGRFYRPGATNHVPLYLDTEVLEFLIQRARDRGIQPHDLANEMLKKDIELVRLAEARVKQKAGLDP